jgi:hypothetical protein
MAYSPTAAPLLLWLTPALLALLLYGLGQGFVKMWITEVPPARFCLYFACVGSSRLTRQCGQCAFLAHPFAARAPIEPSGRWHCGHGARYSSTMTVTSPANKAASESQFSQKLSGAKTADKTQRTMPGSTNSTALFLRRFRYSRIGIDPILRRLVGIEFVVPGVGEFPLHLAKSQMTAYGRKVRFLGDDDAEIRRIGTLV